MTSFDMQLAWPFLVAGIIGLAIFSASDAWVLRREGAAWFEMLRLPLLLPSSALAGSLFLAAINSRPGMDFISSFLFHLSSWSGLVLLVGAALGVILFLPSLFLELRQMRGRKLTFFDYLASALIIISINDKWLADGLLWFFPWGGVAGITFGYLVLSLLRIRRYHLRLRKEATPALG